jgi:hypothetical protein
MTIIFPYQNFVNIFTLNKQFKHFKHWIAIVHLLALKLLYIKISNFNYLPNVIYIYIYYPQVLYYVGYPLCTCILQVKKIKTIENENKATFSNFLQVNRQL